ncbi:MAG: hypothetical protein HY319_18685 [Armatimonadetes bacterium]|nr:hypothetical protein [Armatimonadota bacterium]
MPAPATDGEDGLRDFLEELRAQGSHDSQGEFGLNEALAREKLARWRVPDPYLYAAVLVAAAVQNGASRVVAWQKPGEFSLEYDGPTLAMGQLRDLFSAALSSAAGPLPDLAVAVAAALTLAPAELTIESGGARWTMRDSQPGLEKLAVPRDGTRVWVRLRRGLKALFQRLPSCGGERVALWRACHAPIPIELDGRRLDRAVDLGPALAWSCLRGHVELSVGAPDSPVRRELAVPRGFSAVLAMGRRRPETDPLPEAGLTLIVHGVSYRKPDPFGLPETAVARAVVAAPGLKRDLSRSEVVEDEAYHEVLAALRQQFCGLAVELAEALGDLEAAEQLSARELLERIAEALLDTDLGGDAEAILRRLVQWAPERPLPLMLLANLARRRGGYAEAEAYYLRVRGLEGMVDVQRGQLLTLLAETMLALGTDVAEVESVCGPLLDDLPECHPDGPAAGRRVWEALAVHYWVTGDVSRAWICYRKLLASAEQELGRHHPALTPFLNRLSVLSFRSAPILSERLRQRSVEIWQAHPETAELPPLIQQVWRERFSPG